MKAVQPVHHGRIEWPRWHPVLEHAFGGHRALIVLSGVAVTVAVAVVVASAALAPVRPASSTAAVAESQAFAAYRADAASANALSLGALRKVFDANELAEIAAARAAPAALGASRQDDRALDRQLKGQATTATAIGPARQDDRALDRQLKVKAAAVTAIGAARQDDRTIDAQLKGQTIVVTPVTIDPSALATSKAEERSLDRQVQALKSGSESVPAVPGRFAGKPLPL